MTDLIGNCHLRAAVAGTVETGRAMLGLPGMRASLEAALLKLVGGGAEQAQSIEPVRERAERIALALMDRGVVPLRIGVDGLPGSGKSTLARALAEQLRWAWKCLDGENMDVALDLTQQRVVYEHHRLFRTQDVDGFDAIVYVAEPVEVCKERVLRRARTEAREGMIVDILDYAKLKTIGKVAFDMCRGAVVPIPESNLLMKVRPPGGFGAVPRIVRRLRAAGHETESMGKEEMLFQLVYGQARSGLMAYIMPGAYNTQLLRGLLAGMRAYVRH